MANYAVQADLEAYFGTEQVLIASDRDADGVADTGVITAALTGASQEIDSYLAVRYDLPLTTVPGVLLDVCCDITMYRMSINSTAMTEEKRQRYDDALAWLKNVSKGITTLGLAEASVTVQDSAEISVDSEERLFSRTKMAGVL